MDAPGTALNVITSVSQSPLLGAQTRTVSHPCWEPKQGLIPSSITNIEEYQEVWKKVVSQKSVKVIMEVALAVKEFFKTCNTKRVKQHVGLHFSPLLLNLDSSDNSIKVFLPNKFAMTS
jgi:hypothetical protein